MVIPLEHIDPDATKVVRRLRRYGHTAYLVGGCVRDLLLARRPKDFDIATSAKPEEIRSLFRNCRIIGRRFRLAHVFFGSKIIETSTFRTHPREGLEADELDEGELLIRHDNVFGTAEEDARRRDFTINGLFYDLESGQVIDYVQGLTDLEQRRVRTIGDPDIRFREDPVRILRAIKFASRLGFTIEPETYQAMLAHKGEIPKCAPPRILEELYRLLRGGSARRSMELLEQTGILEVLVPALADLLEVAEGMGPPNFAPAGEDPPRAEEPAHGAQDEAPQPERLVLRFWRTLEALDQAALERQTQQQTNPVLLASLILPFLPELLRASSQRSPSFMPQLEEVAQPVLTQMKVSRRDAARTRQILVAQRRLMPVARRRGRPQSLLHRDYFHEALEIYDIAARAGYASRTDVAEWRHLLAQGSKGHGGAGGPAAAPSGTEPKPRRRRRRRSRRGAGAAKAAEPTSNV